MYRLSLHQQRYSSSNCPSKMSHDICVNPPSEPQQQLMPICNTKPSNVPYGRIFLCQRATLKISSVAMAILVATKHNNNCVGSSNRESNHRAMRLRHVKTRRLVPDNQRQRNLSTPEQKYISVMCKRTRNFAHERFGPACSKSMIVSCADLDTNSSISASSHEVWQERGGLSWPAQKSLVTCQALKLVSRGANAKIDRNKHAACVW